jgi:hypothetical protein
LITSNKSGTNRTANNTDSRHKKRDADRSAKSDRQAAKASGAWQTNTKDKNVAVKDTDKESSAANKTDKDKKSWQQEILENFIN